MRLFESDYIPSNIPFFKDQPVYDGEKTPFIHEGEYEIVGIYSIYPTRGNIELAPNTLDLLDYNSWFCQKKYATRVQTIRRRTDERRSSNFAVLFMDSRLD